MSRAAELLSISDVVALFDELKAKGANIVDGPTERP